MENLTLSDEITESLAVESFPVGITRSWKFGLITRDVYRMSVNSFEITDRSSGWLSATINLNKMIKLLRGDISITNLNWK